MARKMGRYQTQEREEEVRDILGEGGGEVEIVDE